MAWPTGPVTLGHPTLRPENRQRSGSRGLPQSDWSRASSRQKRAPALMRDGETAVRQDALIVAMDLEATRPGPQRRMNLVPVRPPTGILTKVPRLPVHAIRDGRFGRLRATIGNHQQFMTSSRELGVAGVGYREFGAGRRARARFFRRASRTGRAIQYRAERPAPRLRGCSASLHNAPARATSRSNGSPKAPAS